MQCVSRRAIKTDNSNAIDFRGVFFSNLVFVCDCNQNAHLNTCLVCTLTRNQRIGTVSLSVVTAVTIYIGVFDSKSDSIFVKNEWCLIRKQLLLLTSK